ncbi:MAG: DHA2 family efflux MFS transporter permease subunit [Frankiales bacterium]|nr:DHA2 family efflux MFS transporter permease subunit [Frankiales bacterium]
MVVLDATIVNVALPEIQVSLGFSTSSLSWVISAYALVFGGLLLLGARAGDLLGRRTTFLAGIAVFTAGSVAGGLAGSSGLLLAARAAQGAGAAFAAPAALALLTTLFPEGRERLRAIGYYTAVSIGGSAVGLVAGGMLVQWASWRWVMFVNAPIGIALLAVAALTLPSSERVRGHFDLAGAMTSTLGMAGLVYGLTQAGTQGWTDPTTVSSLVLGAALLVGFVVVERRAESPITPLRLFRHRDRLFAYVARLLLVAAMFGMFFFLTQFLQDVLGYSPFASGLAFLPLTVCLFLSSQTSARLAGRVPQRALLVAGFTSSALGLLWISHLSAASGYASVLGPLVLVGLGNGLAFVPLTALALSGVEPRDAGAASGLVNVTQQVGSALGLAVLVTVYDAVAGTGTTAGADTFIAGTDRAFLVSSLLLVVTIVMSAIVLRTRREVAADDLDLELDLELAASESAV